MPKLEHELIRVPQFLSIDDAQPQPIACTICEHELQCGWCEIDCQNCMGTNCLTVCQTPAEGGCANNCDSSCQNCLGTACQTGCQGCQDTCEINGQQPSGAKLEFGTVTATSIQVRIVGLDTQSWTNYGTSKVPRYNSFEISCIGDVRTVGKGRTSGTSAYFNFTGLTPGTSYEFAYIVNFTSNTGVTNDYTGGYANQDTLDKVRPRYFSWKRGLVSSKPVANELPRGGDIPPYLTADGWNTYTANINAVREYRGLGRYSFTAAVARRTELSAAMVNQAIKAINDMSPPISPPGQTSSMSTPGSASLFNKLVDSLNSIT